MHVPCAHVLSQLLDAIAPLAPQLQRVHLSGAQLTPAIVSAMARLLGPTTHTLCTNTEGFAREDGS